MQKQKEKKITSAMECTSAIYKVYGHSGMDGRLILMFNLSQSW